MVRKTMKGQETMMEETKPVEKETTTEIQQENPAPDKEIENPPMVKAEEPKKTLLEKAGEKLLAIDAAKKEKAAKKEADKQAKKEAKEQAKSEEQKTSGVKKFLVGAGIVGAVLGGMALKSAFDAAGEEPCTQEGNSEPLMLEGDLNIQDAEFEEIPQETESIPVEVTEEETNSN